jgi:hypothetical protein
MKRSIWLPLIGSIAFAIVQDGEARFWRRGWIEGILVVACIGDKEAYSYQRRRQNLVWVYT